jgi:hypothetical protein
MKPYRLAGLALFIATAAHAAPAEFVLVGEDGKATTVTAAQIKALPHHSATLTHEGKTMGFSGPLLSEVLERVNAPLGTAMRGGALSDVVIVTASDGYVVSLALSDLEPSIRPSTVILADETAEHGALDKDGPFRLVIDGDLKPARSERNVVKIEVRRLGPTPQPKPH